ncbi:A-kinase anchor protein 14-like [Patiria miniata]|uniref:A-kinase anchor protein 14 n=1 Tax=Patiria miniata TaxID=46514 RepID=A0A913ZGW0_PATMI|nr:A-kinase anchor protein 14-like [Patiria miniata]
MTDLAGLERQAHNLVDLVIDNSIKRVITDLHSGDESDLGRPVSSLKDYDSLLFREIEEHEVQNIEWMTIDEFTVEKGEAKINAFVKTWEYQASWLYCIDFLREEDDKYSKKYRYQVRWSIPTRRKPIPRATACVYFTIEVSKIKPGHHPVEVYYVFETNQLVHKPGLSRFRERWLKDIIESKIMMMEAVQF